MHSHINIIDLSKKNSNMVVVLKAKFKKSYLCDHFIISSNSEAEIIDYLNDRGNMFKHMEKEGFKKTLDQLLDFGKYTSDNFNRTSFFFNGENYYQIVEISIEKIIKKRKKFWFF